MHTAHTATTRGGGSAQGGVWPGGVWPRRGLTQEGLPREGGISAHGGVPCDLSHHAFDVTCMLPPHQLRPTNSAAAYIVVVQGMMGYTLLPPLTESQTLVKT